MCTGYPGKQAKTDRQIQTDRVRSYQTEAQLAHTDTAATEYIGGFLGGLALLTLYKCHCATAKAENYQGLSDSQSSPAAEQDVSKPK